MVFCILLVLHSSPHNISVDRLFTTLRIIGTSNGGVWTSITGVFWGPPHSHFWGVRILRVDSIFPLSWNIVCFAPYPAAIILTNLDDPTDHTKKKNTEALWYRYRYQVQHFQDTNLHKTHRGHRGKLKKEKHGAAGELKKSDFKGMLNHEDWKVNEIWDVEYFFKKKAP